MTAVLQFALVTGSRPVADGTKIRPNPGTGAPHSGTASRRPARVEVPRRPKVVGNAERAATRCATTQRANARTRGQGNRRRPQDGRTVDHQGAHTISEAPTRNRR